MTFHLDEKSAFRQVDLPIQRLTSRSLSKVAAIKSGLNLTHLERLLRHADALEFLPIRADRNSLPHPNRDYSASIQSSQEVSLKRTDYPLRFP